MVATKVGETFSEGQSYFNFSPEAIQLSVEQSLKRLCTDYLDIVFVHSNGDDLHLIEQDNVFATLQNLKEAGKIRAYGMSTKTIAGGMRTIDLADIAMVTFNPSYIEEERVIAYAHQRKKSIFIKKAFASGHLNKIHAADPIAFSLQYIFSKPGVTSVIVGTTNPHHLRQNVSALPEL